jgi:hypothetical protein
LTEHPASVVRSTSSRLAIPLRLASRSILSSGEVRFGSTHHQNVAASETQNIKGSLNMDHVIRVVTEIKSLPKKIKREAGLCLSRSCKLHQSTDSSKNIQDLVLSMVYFDLYAVSFLMHRK